MTEPLYDVLFLCTGSSARSILTRRIELFLNVPLDTLALAERLVRIARES